MTYAEKLKDPRWQKMRLEILQRDEFTCHLCSDNKSELHVHHKFYEKGKMPWDYQSDMLVTLCAECHKKVEELGNSIKDLICYSPKTFEIFSIIHESIIMNYDSEILAILKELNSIRKNAVDFGIEIESSQREHFLRNKK